MPTTTRCLAALLSALLLFPPGDAAAFGHKKKKPAESAASESPLTPDQRALHVLNRLTFGPGPGDVAAVEAMGLDKWIDAQLNPQSIDDAALEQKLAAYPAMRLSLHDRVQMFPSPQMIRQAEQGRLAIPRDPVEHAIYEDQIAQLRERQQQKQGAAGRVQSAAQPEGAPAPNAAGTPSTMSGDEMAPPPSPDMEAANAKPEPATASDEQQAAAVQAAEDRLYADLGATSLVNLPPAQRVQKLIAMQPGEFRETLRRLSRPDRVALFAGLTPEQRETVFALINPQLVVGGELLVTRVMRDVYSQRQLQEVMTDFWLNHFNVYLRKGPFAPWYLADYQDKVIRPRALGKFEDLLVATAQSPAMLFYLDQTESVGPHSMAAMRAAWFQRPNGKRQTPGINENYARELMELHTLGVDGGYTQKDVVEVAKAFTGWGIERPNQGGEFVFNPRRHEPGPKFVLGRKISDRGEAEGREILHMLAMSPATAHHVSYQIAQRFVTDTPPPALVDAMASTWMNTGGDIREVLRTMLERPEFWSKEAYRSKVKTPEEYVISAVRATGGEVVHPAALVEAIGQLGMPLFGCQTPNGYAWTAQAWLNSGELLDRMNFSMALADNSAGAIMDWDQRLGIGAPQEASAAEKENRLETTLLGEAASEHTRSAAMSQLARNASGTNASGTNGSDSGMPRVPRRVNFVQPREFGQLLLAAAPLPPPADADAALLAGLLLGSPEFQRR